jgi:AraC-like DNA-binding protein
MSTNITVFANDDIVAAIDRHISSSQASFSIIHKADSYMDCLAPSIQNKANVFILQAKSPVAAVDDLLYELQGAGFSPIYILFHISGPREIRFAATSDMAPLAAAVVEMFVSALEDMYVCKQIRFRTMLLSDDPKADGEAAAKRESLLEILRGCDRREFLLNRRNFNLDLKDGGYYLFFWELMGIEFTDHEINKFIYNFSGEMLLRECAGIIRRYNGGEVFYSTPNLLCIIINEFDTKSRAEKHAEFEEMIRKLAFCTGNKVACRYLSDRANGVKELRCAYEKYHSIKSVAFFLRDMPVIRPKLVEERKRFTDTEVINTLLHDIANFIRYDISSPMLEENLHKLYFDILKPAMSYTLYYSGMAVIYNAIAEVHPFDGIIPGVNNSPNLLQFSSIEEQYDILIRRISELRAQFMRAGRANSPLVLKAMNYIADNYTKNISVTDISGVLFISGVYLSQVFKRETGMGIIRYVISYRVKQAKRLLRETDDFIYAISESVGFNDCRHFSRTFKEFTGDSPKEYRKKYRKKYSPKPDRTYNF